VAKPVEVAGQERLVEAELVVEQRHLLRRGAVAEQRGGGRARQQVHQAERQQRGAPDDRDRQQQPAADHPQRG
jgi:hypothetical protein